MQKIKEPWFQKIEKMHPYQTLMYLGMFGSGLIFLFMTLAFLGSETGNMEGIGFKMPKSFILSTLIILISGYTASKMLLHFKEEKIKKLKDSMLITFFLGLCFTLLQFLGWKELTLMGVDFKGLPSGSFLYVLSGIHIFHLIGAMVFSILMVYKYHKTEKDEIQHLLVLTNPYEKMRIQLFTTYWHFMDLIWIVLFLIFVIRF
ncbi:cytochrome c oxidase subunit 3 [Shivajiella indica]|uniref:Heme-copper oxidase subunit III n=1 Tax=Shivajiella indica TaxID=872115 RepID=A0ABW5BDT7_9BACT